MGQEKQTGNKSRRGFFSSFFKKPEMVKMLTPDGKLVEVDKSVIEKATSGKKATNNDIYDWMKNPSKEK